MRTGQIVGSLVLALLLAAPVAAQEAKKFSGPHAELEGRKPVTISQGPVSVRLGLVKVGRGEPIPVADVSLKGAKVLELGERKAGYLQIGAHVRIITLDKSTAQPQVVLNRYTGGAHCCTETRIATLSGGKWAVVNGGTRDGDEGFSFEDIDGDGAFEMVGADNRFLYRFDSYAGSYPPPQIYQLRGGKLVDVTRDEKFRAFLRAELARQEKETDENPESWKTNGFLAGWVAHKALIGEQADAWQRMLKLYSRENLWGVAECDGEKPAPKCSDPKQSELLFPQALRAFLVKSGYLAADDFATR